MGVISPVGHDVDTFWSAVLNGETGIGPVTRFDASNYSTRIAAEVKDFDGSKYIDKKELRRMDLSGQYAIVASDQAIANSGLDLKAVDLDMCGVIIGSGIGGISTFEKQHGLLLKSGPGKVSPFFIPSR
jgi:3-oxoacyl-[acyl-carrier-protein] synthase II